MGRFSVLKAIDEFILPFVVFFTARYVGVFVAPFITSTSIELGPKIELTSLPFIDFSNQLDQYFSNSLSWAFTAAILGVFFGFTAFRILHLNESWLHPKEAASIHHKSLQPFVISGEEALHQIIAWSSVTLLALNLAVVDAIVGDLSLVVFGFVLAVTALLTVLFILSWVREGNLDRKEIKNKYY